MLHIITINVSHNIGQCMFIVKYYRWYPVPVGVALQMYLCTYTVLNYSNPSKTSFCRKEQDIEQPKYLTSIPHTLPQAPMSQTTSGGSLTTAYTPPISGMDCLSLPQILQVSVCVGLPGCLVMGLPLKKPTVRNASIINNHCIQVQTSMVATKQDGIDGDTVQT